MRRLLASLAALGLVVLVVVGVSQATRTAEAPAERAAPPFDLGDARARLRGAPAPLASLHADASRLLPGGTDAFASRLASLEGHPVVVNKWASWCAPCRAEFPAFQSQATKRGRTVAFLGLNSGDKNPAAAGFLRRRPLPFPSYTDPDEAIARELRIPANFPMTLFVDRRGRTAFIHPGPYLDEADLAADIERYLDA